MKTAGIVISLVLTTITGLFIFSQKGTSTPDAAIPLESSITQDTVLRLPRFSNQIPTLVVKKNPDDTISNPLQIKNFKMDVKVIGNIATTTMDITFYNDYNRVLDGQFSFPLGDGQTVSYFAMETNGVLQEASVVEKTKGRVVYEAIVRKQVDPGLLEKTVGNNFRSRVYPIPAKGGKRIVVGFEHELTLASSSYIYYQPFFFKEKLDKFSIRTEIFQQSVMPSLYGEEPINIQFDKWEQNWVAEKTFTNYVANKPLAFAVPFAPNVKPVFVEKGNADKNYFHFTIQPKITLEGKNIPKQISLFYDVSGSSELTNQEQTLKFLEQYIQKISYPAIQLVLFSNEVHETVLYTSGKESWEALQKKIKASKPDGATQLGCLDFSKYSGEEYLLVSDGLTNFGERKPVFGIKPVYTICASPKADHSFLKYIAMTTGGTFIDLTRLSSSEALNAVSSTQFRLISAQYNSAFISEVYPSKSKAVTGSFSMAGTISGTGSDIVLNFGIGNKITYTETIHVSNEPGSYKNMVPKMWAQKKLEELDLLHETNEKEIVALGKSFEIVTRYTSLIILDNLQDYLTHKIEPKDPKLKKEYLSSIREEEKQKDDETKTHLDKVVNEFLAWSKWYDSNFVYKPLEGVKTKGNVPRYRHEEGSFEQREMILTDSVVLDERSISSGSVSYSFSANASAANSNMSTELLKDKTDVELKSSIKLNAWEADAPYMKTLKETSKEKLYEKYLELKPTYQSTPSFFVDVSDYFFKQGESKLALRILSNLSELDLENPQLLRVLAKRLQQMNYNMLAIKVYEEVLALREEEPQSYRDLGLAYEQNKEYQKAFDIMSKVLTKSWDSRFPEIETLVAIEINHLLAMSPKKLNSTNLDKRLIKAMPSDVRVVINWDTDNCDMDLWVTDPHNEKCFYSHALTNSGGKMTRDFTGGYGPEVFMIKKGTVGNYTVEVNYYGDSNQSLSGPTTVQAELYTNYGRPNETKKVITLRLEGKKDVVKLADYSFQ